MNEKDNIENAVNLEPTDQIKEQAKKMIEVFLEHSIDQLIREKFESPPDYKSTYQNEFNRSKQNAIKCYEQIIISHEFMHLNIVLHDIHMADYLTERIQHYKALKQAIKDYETRI